MKMSDDVLSRLDIVHEIDRPTNRPIPADGKYRAYA